MPKKGNINLETFQWTTIGRQCNVFGRKTKPTRTEIFFSPMEIAGAANHSRDGANGTGPMQMAFPTPLKVYQSRFLKKDPVTSREDFNPINSVLNDGLYGEDCMTLACDAYAAWTKCEFNSRGTVSAAGVYDWPERKEYVTRWRTCYAFCHYFISYNPFWASKGEAYAACKEEYTRLWLGLNPGQKKMVNMKDVMKNEGMMRWCLRHIQQGPPLVKPCLLMRST
jgi:hypothetical protein